MGFSTTQFPDSEVVCVHIPPQLTSANADELIRLLRDLVEKGTVRIVLDMQETRRVDSSGIGAIVSRISYLRSHQGDVRLAAVQDFVKKVLQITHLDKILQIYPTCEKAVESFKEKP